jgi:hypothetical protein
MRIVSAVLLVLAATACGPGKPPPPPAAAEEDVIGAPLHDALDKARGVEQLEGDRKDRLDDAVDGAN